jgi:c-di-GMP-related signal transduction protein
VPVHTARRPRPTPNQPGKTHIEVHDYLDAAVPLLERMHGNRRRFLARHLNFTNTRQASAPMLKINRHDAARTTQNGHRCTLVRAHDHSEPTLVAEGIETCEDLAKLAETGCEYGQGYLFARPMRQEDAAEWLLVPGSLIEAEAVQA